MDLDYQTGVDVIKECCKFKYLHEINEAEFAKQYINCLKGKKVEHPTLSFYFFNSLFNQRKLRRPHI